MTGEWMFVVAFGMEFGALSRVIWLYIPQCVLLHARCWETDTSEQDFTVGDTL